MSTRYSRQELFQPIGTEGQKRLNDSKAIIIGAGALGTASAEMLVRAGVGSVTILDRDYIEWSNLQRQQLYTEQDVKDRLPKAVAAEKRLKQVNSDVHIKGIVIDVTAHNIDELVSEASIIVDAADNFEVRMIANDAAVKHQIPFLYGACVASYGIQFTVIPGETPCLHCLLEHLPAQGMTCDTAGIISPVVQQVAAYQVADALKYLTGHQVTPILKSFDLAKASLEASVKYLAADLGAEGIRVNSISAGPIRTLSAKGISGFNTILKDIEERAPLRRTTTPEEVGDTALFLFSDLSRGMTGENLHVDSGFHIIAR
ncbi:hypothetical protein BSAF29S_04194 [Bacillus safensis subsp. safensis]